MATETEIRQKMVDAGRRVIDHLYEVMAPNTPTEYKTTTVQEALDLPQAFSDDRCVELQALGILTRTINYGRYNPDGTYRIGRFAMWELHMDKAKALTVFEAWAARLIAGETTALETHQQAGRVVKPKTKTKTKMKRMNGATTTTGAVTVTQATVIATDEAEETRAISGPDAPSPMAALVPLRKTDDANALVAAARQYAKRSDNMNEQVAALKATAKALGIEIDEAAMLLSIHLVPDERLETISLVLPVIDRLDRAIERLSATVEEYRDRAKAADQLAIDNRRLRIRVEALISEKVRNEQRAAQA